MKKLIDSKSSTTSKSSKVDFEKKYNSLKKKFDKFKKEHNEMVDGIQKVMDRYFEGEANPEYDPNYSAQEAIDDISSWL